MYCFLLGLLILPEAIIIQYSLQSLLLPVLPHVQVSSILVIFSIILVARFQSSLLVAFEHVQFLFFPLGVFVLPLFIQHDFCVRSEHHGAVTRIG